MRKSILLRNAHALVLAGGLSTACAGGGSGDAVRGADGGIGGPDSGGAGGTAAEGIYQLASWTENTASCDAEGASIADDNSDEFLYVKNSEFAGQRFISVATCADLETCRGELGDDTINLSGFSLEDGSDSQGWSGSGYFISGQDTCSGEVFEDRLIVEENGVTVERRAKSVEEIPLDSDGFCDGDAAEAMATSLPCTRLERLQATLLE